MAEITNEQLEELKEELVAAKKENKALLKKLREGNKESETEFKNKPSRKITKVTDLKFIKDNITKGKK